MRDTTFHEMADLALRTTGQMIPASKAYLVEARLAHIVRREGFASADDLASCLKARPNPAFEAEIAAGLLSHESWFFRDRDLYSQLIEEVLPDRLKASKAGRIKVWCAGGGQGQEAYSLAIALAEQDGTALGKARIDILSTDVCKRTTDQARRGVFGHFAVQRGLSIHRLLAHFDRLDTGEWQVNDELRRRVSFREHNLLEDAAGLGSFDIILCRNVLNGMDREMRGRISASLAERLVPGGVLFLGEGESLTGVTRELEPSRRMRGGWEVPSGARRSAA